MISDLPQPGGGIPGAGRWETVALRAGSQRQILLSGWQADPGDAGFLQESPVLPLWERGERGQCDMTATRQGGCSCLAGWWGHYNITVQALVALLLPRPTPQVLPSLMHFPSRCGAGNRSLRGVKTWKICRF